MAQTNAPARPRYPLPVERGLILASLLILTAVAWAVIVLQADSMDTSMAPMQSEGEASAAAATNEAAMTGARDMPASDADMRALGEETMTASTHGDMSLTMDMSALLFLGVWVAMMVAIMFPTAAPMILAYAKVQGAGERRAVVPTWLFTLAYIALWSATGFIAYGAAVGGDELSSRFDWIASNGGRIGGGLLLIAGLYQLTPLKDKCLSTCRTPMSFILGNWRDGRFGAIRMGVRHGFYCLGCCWFLFAILFPLGMMNVAAMAIIALVIFAEKSLAIGPRVARVAAVGLIIYGATVVVAIPDALPTSMTI